MWMKEVDSFLQEFFQLDGRGHFSHENCADCLLPEPRYRCIDCCSRMLFCQSCLVKNHKRSPYHRVEVLPKLLFIYNVITFGFYSIGTIPFLNACPSNL
jgi:hypothetical protein